MAHSHKQREEAYVVTTGSGWILLDDGHLSKRSRRQ
jgi:hypothetical protein